MATKMLDFSFQSRVDETTKILTKHGATSVTVYRNHPNYPEEYGIAYYVGNKLYQASDDSLEALTLLIAKNLKKAKQKLTFRIRKDDLYNFIGEYLNEDSDDYAKFVKGVKLFWEYLEES